MIPKLDGSDHWHGAWLDSAQRLDSPNFGSRPADAVVDLIVVHSISLPPGSYGGHEVAALFTNQLDWKAHPYFQSIRGAEVSAHFFIRRDGRLMQFVSADERAWHAGQSSFQGRSDCNDYSIGIELEGLEGSLFKAAQYLQLAALCLSLRQRYPIRHVVGHEHVAPGRKFDPGEGFDWRLLMKTVGWPSQCFPALSILKP